MRISNRFGWVIPNTRQANLVGQLHIQKFAEVEDISGTRLIISLTISHLGGLVLGCIRQPVDMEQ